MSLDVYLRIRDCCEHCGRYGDQKDTVFEANITHNLNRMADEAGLYEVLWRPDECFSWQNKPVKAKYLIPDLERGLKDLKARPAFFQLFDSPNGWGVYRHFVPFVEKYLAACREYSDADVEVSR